MKTTLALLILGFIAVSAGAGKEPKVYNHVGVMGGGSVHPASSYSLDGQTVNCFDHTEATDCTTGGLGYFQMTFDDGTKHLLEFTMRGKTVLQDIQLNQKLTDKRFRYRLLPDEKYDRHGYVIEHVICTPNRDKDGHETKGESCFGYSN